jgi:anti-sigma regulatory factor (Ser/Thr protein kinase)
LPFGPHTSFLLDDRTFSSFTKREVKFIARDIGFTGTKLAEIEIIVSEAISNLAKHATGGRELLVKKIIRNDIPGIEIISLDNGPGIPDTDHVLKDGISTSSTIGGGLGAIKRLSDEFDLYSIQPLGTIVLSRKFLSPVKQLKPVNIYPSAIIVPKAGETVSGDGYAYKQIGNILRIIVLDGLGHGPDAGQAVSEAINFFLNDSSILPSEVLIYIHDKIRKTRGAVAAVMDINQTEKTISYCGIGNISCKLAAGATIKSFISYNGVLGMNRPNTLHTQKIDYTGPVVLVAASDGIKSRWESQKYAGIQRHDGSTIAASIYKEFTRRTDDSLVLAIHLK